MDVDAPSLEAFKARLDVAPGRLVWWLAILHIAGGSKLDNHRGPFQSRTSYELNSEGIFPSPKQMFLKMVKYSR